MTNLPFEVARAAVTVNAVLLVGLVAIWARNYRSHGATHTLGLLVFGIVLFLQNLLTVYLYSFHPTFHDWVYNAYPVAQYGTMAVNLLETCALAFLAWVTWQ